MAGEVLPGVKLAPGEAIDLRVEASSSCHIVLTNQRLVVWQRREGVEQVTPIALEHLLDVEMKEERGRLWPLGVGLGLSILGASLIPWLIAAFSEGGVWQSKLQPLLVGGSGVGLVVAGLVTLSLYLRRALFPQAQVVFYGAPQVVVEIPAEARGRLRGLAQRLKELRGATIPTAPGGGGPLSTGG